MDGSRHERASESAAREVMDCDEEQSHRGRAGSLEEGGLGGGQVLLADREGGGGDPTHPGVRPLRRAGTVYDASEASARLSPGDMPVCHSLSQGLW